MPYRVLFSPSAQADLQNAYDYYEEAMPDLGERFILSVEERLERLTITPGAGEVRYEKVRCTLLKKFPYLIHYTVDDDSEQVIILRIFHTSQKPLWE